MRTSEAGKVPDLPHRGAAGRRPGGIPAAGRHVLVLPDHPARAVSRDGREQPSARAGAARAARRAVRPQWTNPGREPAQLHGLDRPPAHHEPRSHHPRARGRRRHRGTTRARDRRSGPAPAVLSPHCRDPGREPVAGGGHHGAAARFRAARRGRRARADAALSHRRDGRAPAGIRQRGDRRAADGRQPQVRRHCRTGRHRAHAQPRPDGHRRRQDRRRQQPGARDQDARRGRADRRAAAEADHRLRRAEGRRGRVQGARVLGGGRGHRPAQRRGAVAGQPAGLRPQLVCRRHRPHDLDGAQHRQASSVAEPRHSGPILAGLDVQDCRRGRCP